MSQFPVSHFLQQLSSPMRANCCFGGVGCGLADNGKRGLWAQLHPGSTTWLQLHRMNKKITQLRLLKEEQSLEKQPHEQALVSRLGPLNFHFCLFGLQEDFARGFYHGVLQLPQDYPFSPPKIKFLTENGRFQVGKPICTTFTHYHKETWSSSWNIRTIITGLISFMYSNERGIGGVFNSASRRKTLAKKSLANNLATPLFVQLFKEKLLARAIVSEKEVEQLSKQAAEKEARLNKKKQDISVCEQREEQEESDQKVTASLIINVGTDKTQLKATLQQQLEGMESRKKLHFEGEDRKMDYEAEQQDQVEQVGLLINGNKAVNEEQQPLE